MIDRGLCPARFTVKRFGWLLLTLAVTSSADGASRESLVESRRIVADYRAGGATAPAELAAVAAALVNLGREDPAFFHDALRVYDEAIAADPSNLSLQVELGDLFLARYNGEEARATYEAVLARDSQHAGALVGMARVMRFEGASDVSELIDKSLESDPDQAPARWLLARQHLDWEDYPAADRQAERALAIAPHSPQALALFTASALLSGDEAETKRRLDRALAMAPGDPEVFTVLAEVAARNRLYARAVELANRAVGLDAKSWQAWSLRGINRLRVGNIAEGRQDLETAFVGDPFDVWTKNTLDLLDAMDTYQVIETERFQLVVPRQEAELLALYLGPLAEEAFDALAERYGTAPPTPLRLEVFPRHADFSVRTIGLVGLGALGVSFGPVIALDSPSTRPAGAFHWGTVLWHELAHSFHMHASASRVPRWFTEGLAVFEERRSRPGWGDRVDPELLIAYKLGRLAPVENLNQGFMRPDYPQQIAFSYVQASLVFDFLVERWGFEAVRKMLAGYGKGENTARVVQAALGITLEELAIAYDAAFRQRFAGPLEALEVSEEEAVPGLEALRLRADTNRKDFLANLAIGQSLLEEDPDAAVAYLEQAKALFPTYAGNDSPAWLLAESHRRAGRHPEAVAELEALVALNQAHYPALRALSELAAEQADVATAARALASAQYVYPYAPDDHRQLAEWLTAAGQWDEAVRERRAVLALEPFNRSQALLELARAQQAAGDSKAARSTVLEALELAPSYREAMDLLLELRRERGAA